MLPHFSVLLRVVERQGTIGDAGDQRKTMRAQDHRPLELREDLDEVCLRFCIQPGKRLIKKQYRRLQDQETCKRGALLLALAQQIGRTLEQMRDLQSVTDVAKSVRSWGIELVQRVMKVGFNRFVKEHRAGVLEKQSDLKTEETAKGRLSEPSSR